MNKLKLVLVLVGLLSAQSVKSEVVVEIPTSVLAVNNMTVWVFNYLDSLCPCTPLDYSYVGRVFGRSATVNNLTVTGLGTDEGTISYSKPGLVAYVVYAENADKQQVALLVYNEGLKPFKQGYIYKWFGPNELVTKYVAGFRGTW